MDDEVLRGVERIIAFVELDSSLSHMLLHSVGTSLLLMSWAPT